MTSLNFATIGLKLLGIYFVVSAVPVLMATMTMGAYLTQMGTAEVHPQFAFLLSTLIPGGTQFSIGILLFIFSKLIASRAVSDGLNDSKASAWTMEEIQVIAFALTGLVIVAMVLPNLGRAGLNLYFWYSVQEHGGISSKGSDSWTYAIGTLAQLIIGLTLLLYPHGLRNIWHWLRTAGTSGTS